MFCKDQSKEDGRFFWNRRFYTLSRAYRNVSRKSSKERIKVTDSWFFSSHVSATSLAVLKVYFTASWCAYRFCTLMID